MLPAQLLRPMTAVAGAGRIRPVRQCVWVGVLDVAVAAALRLTRSLSLIDLGVVRRLGRTGEMSVELLFP
jgi:hypothetical protein